MDRKTFFYSIVASIIATVGFLYILQPLTVAAWHLITWASNSVLTSIQDDAILNAALGKRDWLTPWFVCMAACITSSAATWYPMWAVGSRLVRRFHHRLPPTGQIILLLRLRAVLQYRSIARAFLLIAFAIVIDGFAFVAYASFAQRLDAVAPYIEVQAERQLRSRWARMETVSDYRALTADMDQLGAKAGIKLPKVLYR